MPEPSDAPIGAASSSDASSSDASSSVVPSAGEQTPDAPADDEPGRDASAAPPLFARLLAFLAILVAGATGGFIGYAFTDLQCSGDCGTATGIGGLIGAVLAAVGVAVVAVLALRAMAEWRTIQRTGDAGNWRDARALRKEQAAGDTTVPGSSPSRPRVR